MSPPWALKRSRSTPKCLQRPAQAIPSQQMAPWHSSFWCFITHFITSLRFYTRRLSMTNALYRGFQDLVCIFRVMLCNPCPWEGYKHTRGTHQAVGRVAGPLEALEEAARRLKQLHRHLLAHKCWRHYQPPNNTHAIYLHVLSCHIC